MNTAQSLNALYNGVVDRDLVQVFNDGTTEWIKWDESLGPLPTEEQLAEGWALHLKNQRRAEIMQRLSDIDVATIRPLRAVQAGTDTQFDRDKLAALEIEAKGLRDELATLG